MRIPEALEALHRAEQFGYDADSCAAARWNCHMLLGDFESAWCESDAIAARGKPDPHRFWDGKPLAGKRILIRCLHGLGDTLQFIRYAPMLRSICPFVAIESQPALLCLMQESALGNDIFTWGSPEPHWESQVEVTELPRIFRTTLETIPRCVPYIRASRHTTDGTSRGTGGLRVGLVWESSQYNPARSLPLQFLSEILDVDRNRDVRFFSLQAGEARRHVRALDGDVEDLQDANEAVLTTAGHIAGLDLVITVDTMVAHLAAAMGALTWVLVPFQCDWRWMLQRSDSPWYPTMR
ncbi:MAG: hypothetical protein JOZ62_19250, partial [Acidobacteriaceae bacterium]|nr:hypothetical protein [Acidobacteriaceae bacterium]